MSQHTFRGTLAQASTQTSDTAMPEMAHVEAGVSARSSKAEKPHREKAGRGRRVTPADLKGLALDYLDRFAATRQRLRQVMLRKIRKSARLHGDDPEPIIAALDEAIQWLEGRGFLSDKAYAESKARALVARGTSRAHIIANLASKGVGGDDARAALAQVALEYEEPELEAAQRYARRRRIGPYRLDAEARAAARNKDLATMARAGFASRIARQVIDAEDAA